MFFGADLDAGDDVLLETGRVEQVDGPALALSVEGRRPFAIIDANMGTEQAKLELMGPTSSGLDEVCVTPMWDDVPDVIQTWPELDSAGGSFGLQFGSVSYPCSLEEALTGPRQDKNLRLATTLDEPQNIDGTVAQAVILEAHTAPGRVSGVDVSIVDAQGNEELLQSQVSMSQCVPGLRDLGFTDVNLASVREAASVIESMDEGVYGPHLNGASVDETQHSEMFDFGIDDLEDAPIEPLGTTVEEQQEILDNERPGWGDAERAEFSF